MRKQGAREVLKLTSLRSVFFSILYDGGSDAQLIQKPYLTNHNNTFLCLFVTSHRGADYTIEKENAMLPSIKGFSSN